MFRGRKPWVAAARTECMLLLLFKNAMWAAWWPYYTMLLAMEKAATQAAANRPKSPPQAPQARPAAPVRTPAAAEATKR